MANEEQRNKVSLCDWKSRRSIEATLHKYGRPDLLLKGGWSLLPMFQIQNDTNGPIREKITDMAPLSQNYNRLT